MARRGCVGVYGPKTRKLQRKLSFESFGLTFKDANVYMYLGAEGNTPNIDDISNKVFYEIPDKEYSPTPISIPIGMERMSDYKADYSRFGYIDPIQDEQMFRVHIDDFDTLGRELIIGDVFEMPFFSKDSSRSFWEITDVDTKSQYEKFVAIIHARPLEQRRDTVDIPIDRDNDGLMEDIINDQDAQQSEQVESESLTFDGPPPEDEVDYRDDTQKSFLDDPNQEF